MDPSNEPKRLPEPPDLEPDFKALRAYTKNKLALAEKLRLARQALTILGEIEGEQQCGELMVKLAEDRFTLAVLGQFKRGKSSLMNAVIGRDLLPTGVLPLTSAITVLRYGPVERLVVERGNFVLPQELPLAALADYVTETGNPSNGKQVKTAAVELPVPFLRRGVQFVDTPGIGSAIAANTATTRDYLPECDAAIFVTSVDTPMTSLELALLTEVRDYVDKIFFVVNKTDLVAASEREQVLRFVADTIRAQTGQATTKIFPVSARLGLAAKVSGNMTEYERSGMQALQATLAAFLSAGKSATFLAAVARKGLRVLDDLAARGAFDARMPAAVPDRSADRKPGAPVRDPVAAAADAKRARAKLEALYKRLSNTRSAPETEAPSIKPPREQAISVEVSSTRTPSAAEIDLTTQGCPVCNYIEKWSFDFFAHWQYQLGIDEGAQAAFAAELGFCPTHMWQLLAVSSPHGASVGYARLMETLALKLGEVNLNSGDAVRQLVQESCSCRICRMIKAVETAYVTQLAESLREASGRDQYRRSQGVCLRHLALLLDSTQADEIRNFLLSHAVRQFDEDAEDMRSFAMKHEAIRRALQNRNEEDAYRRAVTRLVGGRGVCMPWSRELNI